MMFKWIDNQENKGFEIMLSLQAVFPQQQN